MIFIFFSTPHRLIITIQQKKLSIRQAQYNRDNDLWETNRMLTSGIAQRTSVDTDFEDDSESRVHILIRDLKPPFLDGHVVFTKQLEPVNPIKDPTSDLAIFAHKGSALVRHIREQQERLKGTRKSWEVAGTTIGNIMGVQKPEEQEENSVGQEKNDENNTYKGESKFADHLKDKSDAVSNFAVSKSIREQREYLPVFSVREQLLEVIRENQSNYHYYD